MFNIGLYGGTTETKTLLKNILKNSQFKVTTDPNIEYDFEFVIIDDNFDNDNNKLSERYDQCIDVMGGMDLSNLGIIHFCDIGCKLNYNEKKYADVLIDKFEEYKIDEFEDHKFDKKNLKILYFPFGYNYDTLNDVFKNGYNTIVNVLITDLEKIIKLKIKKEKHQEKKKDKKKEGRKSSKMCWIM